MNNRKIKILYTIPNFDTAGSGKALLNIAKGLDNSLYEPHICCLHDQGDFFKVVKASGIPVHIFEYATNLRPRLKALLKIIRKSYFFRKNKFDIVHSFHYSADYSEPLSVRLSNTKWVFTKKNMSWEGASKNSWKLRSKLAKRIIIQNTDMQKQFYPNSKKTDYITRGVNANEFVPQLPNKDLINEFGISSKHRVIMAVANLAPVKGIEVLISAFDELYDKKQKLKLLIVGDDRNEYAMKLKSLAEKSKSYSNIHFTGKRSDVKELLSLADIFVLPTLDEGRREGSPVSLLEAMSSAKFIIASRVSGIKDILASFKDHMFEPGSVDELVAKLRSSLEKPIDELRKEGQILREEILKNFTIEKEVQKHEEFYQKILKTG